MFCAFAYLVPRPGPCSLKILITAWQGTSVFSQCLSCVRDGFCTHFISYVLMVYQGDERRRYRASPSRNPQGYHPFGTDQSSRRHPYRQWGRYLAERATSRRYLAQRANSRRRAAPRGFSEGPVAKADFRNPQKRCVLRLEDCPDEVCSRPAVPNCKLPSRHLQPPSPP